MTSIDVRSMAPEANAAAGDSMLNQDRWEEIRRLYLQEHGPSRRSPGSWTSIARRSAAACASGVAAVSTRARPDTLLAAARRVSAAAGARGALLGAHPVPGAAPAARLHAAATRR